ncbi:MAG: hypothetical protein ACFFAT_08280 [Promethearchaeota archaeon]
MDRIYRKLQNLGGSIFVSLPKVWTKNFGLKKESSVAIDIRPDGTLLISPKLKQEENELKNEIILNSSKYVAREMSKFILSGIETVIIRSDKEFDKKIRNEISWFVDGLPNTEIIEEERQRIVIQNFGYKKIPTKKIIQRLLFLICDMFDNLLERANIDLKQDFKKLQRFYFILVTHIRTYLRTGIYISDDNQKFTPLEAMDLRMFCEKIEDIGTILKNLRINENVEAFFKKIYDYYKDVMNAYLKKDIAIAHEAWLKKNEIIKQAKLLIENLDYDERDKIKDMITIAEDCKDMAGLI